jgi:hypothetical protein
MATTNKSHLTKIIHEPVWTDRQFWTVQYGELKRGKGRPPKTQHLFKIIGEKLPYAALREVKRHLNNADHPFEGVYVAHDSMGCPRYIGRGDIFSRLAARKRELPLELLYFSFYVVADKKHEREIETLLIRSAGFLLEFNDRKKRVSIESGNVCDFEAGTFFYVRHYKKGRRT